MKLNIKDLDCSKMIVNPLHPQLVNFMEKNIPSLKSMKIDYQDKVFTKSMLYRYILLQYDSNSEIQKMQQLDWFAKKYQSIGYAGFKLGKGNDGHMRFDKRVDEFVFGKNDVVSDMIIDFLAWMNNSQWQYIVFLQESMLGFVRDSLGRKINKHKSSQEYMKLYQDFRVASQDLAKIEDEPSEFVSRFYYKIEQSRLAIKPEDYASAFSSGEDLRADNPYGVNYVIDKIRFLGDDEAKI